MSFIDCRETEEDDVCALFADAMPVILALPALAESCRFRCRHGSTPHATRFPKFNEPGMSTIATAVASVVVGIVASCSFLQDVPGDCNQQAQAKGPYAKNDCRREAHHLAGSGAGAEALWAPHVVFRHHFPFHKQGCPLHGPHPDSAEDIRRKRAVFLRLLW